MTVSKQGGHRGRPLKDNEFFCELCRSKCTRDPGNGVEYGHEFDCDERSDGLRPNRGMPNNE
jgi:hypothetical protein